MRAFLSVRSCRSIKVYATFRKLNIGRTTTTKHLEAIGADLAEAEARRIVIDVEPHIPGQSHPEYATGTEYALYALAESLTAFVEA